MRYRCYQELAKIGRTRCLSVTVLFNAPGVRFKKKLNAKVIEIMGADRNVQTLAVSPAAHKVWDDSGSIRLITRKKLAPLKAGSQKR